MNVEPLITNPNDQKIDELNTRIDDIENNQYKIDDCIRKVEDTQSYMKKNIHNNYNDIKRVNRKIKNIQYSISATSSNIKTLDTNLSSLRNREQRDYNMCLDNHLELGVLKTKTKINRIMDIILITMMTINVILDFIIILGGMY